MLLILQAIAHVGALNLHRSDHHEKLLRNVVETAQGGGLPAVGYAVAYGSRTVWAVALPCGVAALLNPFPVVPWRDMASSKRRPWGWFARSTRIPPVWTRRGGRLAQP